MILERTKDGEWFCVTARDISPAFHEKYEILRELGRGACSTVYLGITNLPPLPRIEELDPVLAIVASIRSIGNDQVTHSCSTSWPGSAAEGPVLDHRAFRLYTSASGLSRAGRAILATCRRALKRDVKNAQLESELDGPGSSALVLQAAGARAPRALDVCGDGLCGSAAGEDTFERS